MEMKNGTWLTNRLCSCSSRVEKALFRNGLMALVVGALILGASPAMAQSCMEDVAGFGLNCNANDIEIATATNILILDDGCQSPQDTVDFQATFNVVLTAQTRYDLGLWFATDGDPNLDGALTGTCQVGSPDVLDLDGDSCGDIDDAHNPQTTTIDFTEM